PHETLSDSSGEAAVMAVLGVKGRDLLRRLRPYRMVIQHDVASAMLPFEMFTVDGHRYSIEKGVVRRPVLDDVPLLMPRRVRRGVMNLLLITNPTGDLAGADVEAQAVKTALHGSNNVRVRELVKGEATRAAVLDGLRDPEIDIFHFCGHAFYQGP